MSISEKRSRSASRPASSPPYRTIPDKELTLVRISCDFVCACIALPVSLILLSHLSAVPDNAPGHWRRTFRSTPRSRWPWSSRWPREAVIVTVAAGSAVASASTRLRSGALHAHLVSHVATGAGGGANALAPGLALKGSAVMAAIVGVLAPCALAFLIVTFIRRRVTAA